MECEEEPGMGGNDKRKQSLYFPEDMLDEISREAVRLDRSLSWVVQRAWLIASKELGKFPSTEDLVGTPSSNAPAGGPAAAPEPVAAQEHEAGSQVREFLRRKYENV
jgi:uncharacterized small protein (TIGR04563 family)